MLVSIYDIFNCELKNELVLFRTVKYLNSLKYIVFLSKTREEKQK